MREITYESIVSAVRDLCIEANCALPCDLKEAIAKAEQTEPSPVGRSILGDLVENYTFAGEKRLPICQDTGMAVVFCQLGQDAHITGGLLRDAVNEGVSKGYTEGFLRKSVVRDPIRRVNTDDNTPAVLHVELVEGDQLTITVAPKGFGSENMTSLHMLKPSITQETIEDTIVRRVRGRKQPLSAGGGGRRSGRRRRAVCHSGQESTASPGGSAQRGSLLRRDGGAHSWKRSIGWASAPRGWAGRPPRWPWPSTPTPPTLPVCPAASIWGAM